MEGSANNSNTPAKPANPTPGRIGSAVVVGVLLAAALAGWLVAQSLAPSGSSGLVAKVTVYGQVEDVFPLNVDVRQTYATDAGTNTVVVEGGKVHIEDADCAGGDCMKQGAIDQTHQLLVCLPHQLVVEIVPADGDATAPSEYHEGDPVGASGIDATLG